MAGGSIHPVADVYNSGWTAASGTTLWNMIQGSDADTSYIQVANTGLPFKVTMRPAKDAVLGPRLFPVSVVIEARTTTGSAFINGSAYDKNGLYLGDVTKNINSTTYSAYVVNMSSTLGGDYSGISIEIQNSANPGVSSQLATLRITDMYMNMSASPFQEKYSFQEAINHVYGYGNTEYTPEQALTRYLGLENTYNGQYSIEQLYNILHFNSLDKESRAWDPIADYANRRASIDLGTFSGLDGKRYTREEAINKFSYLKQVPSQDIIMASFPKVERWDFTRNAKGLTSNLGNALYTNANLASAYQENGTSLFVGYSAGIFATGTVSTLLQEAPIGNVMMSMDITPFTASSSITGKQTIFEIPNYFRLDYSGSGFNQFVMNLHDGSSYVSALQSNGVTFGAREKVRVEILYVIPELTVQMLVNNSANAFYSDSGFNGNTLGSTFYLGTDASKANAFSGAINEFRFTDDIKLLD